MEEAPSVIALLPIKDHSARIPNKNFRDFCGQPLYCWILDTLAQVKQVKRVIISTDSFRLVKGVKEYAHKWPKEDWLQVDWRPSHLCGDNVSVNAIWLELLTRHEEEYSPNQLFLQTHTTNPLLQAKTIGRLIDFFQGLPSQAVDSLFTVTGHQSRFYTQEGKAINHNPQELIATQDLSPLLEENSCAYLFTKKSLMANNHRIGSSPWTFELNKVEAIDIDWEYEFLMAESLMKQRLGKGVKKVEEEEEEKQGTILITGASGGIGQAIAQFYKEKKQWRVIGLDLKAPPPNPLLFDDFIEQDLSLDYQQLTDVYWHLTERHIEQIDLLVHNAGVLFTDADRILSVNLRSPFHLTKMLESMMKPGSAIIHIASVHALVTAKNMSLYPASKAGLVGLTKSLALDLADKGIRVNCISPGPIDTPMLKDHLTPEELARTEKACLSHRLGQPQDIVQAIDYLYRASFVNGTNLVVDGGLSIQLTSEN